MARTDLDGQGGGVRIAADVPPLPLVRGTAAELTHLFSDLLLNARDAMPSGGTVEVRGREHHGTVEVTVADRGRGIPEESLARMFDPFFSGSESRETGLVLSIAYGLMHRLGGSISAANRTGGGAVFTLTFPLASPPQRRDDRRHRREPRRIGDMGDLDLHRRPAGTLLGILKDFLARARQRPNPRAPARRSRARSRPALPRRRSRHRRARSRSRW